MNGEPRVQNLLRNDSIQRYIISLPSLRNLFPFEDSYLFLSFPPFFVGWGLRHHETDTRASPMIYHRILRLFLTSFPRLHYPTWSRHRLPRERHHDLSRFTFFFAIFAFFRYRITVRVSKENLMKDESVHSPDLKVPPSQFSSAVRI